MNLRKRSFPFPASDAASPLESRDLNPHCCAESVLPSRCWARGRQPEHTYRDLLRKKNLLELTPTGFGIVRTAVICCLKLIIRTEAGEPMLAGLPALKYQQAVRYSSCRSRSQHRLFELQLFSLSQLYFLGCLLRYRFFSRCL